MEARTLPLFPLHRVLLPGAALAVQVFEERYRLMMDQLEDDRFGITLIRRAPEVGGSAEYHSVGTEARIVDRQELPDGRLLLAVVGERRFEVTERLSDVPYPLALVEFFSEENDSWSGIGALRNEVEQALRRYLALIVESGERADLDAAVAKEPREASYEVASLMRISHPERQELLEAPTVQARLEREQAVLRREIELLELVLGRPE